MIVRSRFVPGGRERPPGRPAPSVARTVALAFLAVLGCEDGTGPVDLGERILVVGVARQDVSPEPLEGFVALFFDLDADSLLRADARVIRTSVLPGDTVPLTTPVTAGIVDGVFYVGSADILSGLSYRLEATVSTDRQPVDVLSAPVLVPAIFDVEIPHFHPLNEPLTVGWEATPDASNINVAVGSGFMIDLPATDTSVEIPTTAFAGLAPGDSLQIEVTAYNDFYVNVAGGINSLSDAEELARMLAPVDRVEGAVGTFGGATTVGAYTTFE